MYLSLDKETKILNMYNTINVKFKTKDTFALISTNESGLEIFTLCDGTRTQEEIVEALESQYDLNEESINYIKSFINYHISVGLIKEGYDADLLLFNEDIEIQKVFVGGKEVYNK